MKQRVISAIVMIIIAVPIIVWGGSIFRIAVAVLGMLALKELINLKKSHNKIPMVMELLSYICLLLIILSEYEGYSILYGINYKGISILLLALLMGTLFYKNNEYTTKDAFTLIGYILLIGTSFNAMILIRYLSLYKFCGLLLIFVLTDTFALFGGKLLGHHKLISHVSPNKTVEGSIIGSLVATIGVSIFWHFLVSPINIKIILGILLLSIIGQVGDLIFSKIKRENDIKDFSNLIPGHGGILDRLDSTIAIMLGYLILYSLF